MIGGSGPGSSGSKLSGGAIAGIAVGSSLVVLSFLTLLLWRYRHQKQDSSQHPGAEIEPFPPPATAEATVNSTTSAPSASPIPNVSSKTGATVQTRSHGRLESASMHIPVATKRRQLPSAPLPAESSRVPSSIEPPTNSVSHPSRPTDDQSVEQLANAVVERLASRFQSSSHDPDAPPPDYSQ